ncbi:MAG: DUF1800 family protein, partial [Sulfurovaceae bacterium]|nr:DUF1800 family protein [Sulfurovaceae bacterium]
QKTTEEIQADIEQKIATIKKNISKLLGIREGLLTKDPIALAKEGDNSLLNTSLQLQKTAKEMKKAMKKEVRGLKHSILYSYRTLGRELKKLEKKALKSGDSALVKALDSAMDDSSIFDKSLVENVKKVSKELIKSVNNFWSGHEGTLDEDALNEAVKTLEVIVDGGELTPTPTPIPTVTPTPIVIPIPTLTSTPTSTSLDAVNIEINGEVGTTVWINEIQIGIIGENGKLTTSLDTSGENGNKEFSIILKDSNGNVSEPLLVSIERINAHIPSSIDDATAIRFLNKATFGANKENIEALKSKGVVRWLDEQLNLPLNDKQYLIKMIEEAKNMRLYRNTHTIKEYLDDNDIVFNKNEGSFHSPVYRISAWFDIALRAKDQLRQRVTYALSQ